VSNKKLTWSVVHGMSTTRWAYDIGYEVIVCADACADPDPRAYAALLDESVFPDSWIGLWRIARVLPTSQINELRPPQAD